MDEYLKLHANWGCIIWGRGETDWAFGGLFGLMSNVIIFR